jgi:hypothetical protein
MVPSSSLQYLAIAQYLEYQYQYQRWCRRFSCAQGYCRCSGAVSWMRGRCYGYADCFEAIYRAPNELATLSRAANIDLSRIYCPGDIFACLFAICVRERTTSRRASRTVLPRPRELQRQAVHRRQQFPSMSIRVLPYGCFRVSWSPLQTRGADGR